MLAALGGVLGILLAFWGVRGLVASLPANVPRADEIRVDGVVLAFTGALAVLTGLLFGIAPAWKISTGGVQGALREEGRGTVGPAHHRLRNSLVVAEIALALVLLVGAGLLDAQLRARLRRGRGVPGGRASSPRASRCPRPASPTRAKRAAFVRAVVEQVKARARRQVASGALPLLGGWRSSFTLEGRPEPPPGQLPSADITRVTPDYFKAMSVRVQEGRVFTDHDTAEAPLVAMVDETFVRAHFQGESPLGKRFRFGRSGPRTRTSSGWRSWAWMSHVKNYGVDQESRVEIYLPYYQSPVGSVTSRRARPHRSGRALPPPSARR